MSDVVLGAEKPLDLAWIKPLVPQAEAAEIGEAILQDALVKKLGTIRRKLLNIFIFIWHEVCG